MLKRSCFTLSCLCLALFMLVGCSSGGSGSSPSGTPTSPTSASPTASTAGSAPFSVSSIDMAATPASIAGIACGTHVEVVYTATFHVPAHTPGGTVQFIYTVNNGRSTPSASVTFAAGERTKTYTFSWSGNLVSDNVYPGPGGVVTSSPNVVRSPLVRPAGTCVAQVNPFKVTGVNLTVDPTSIAGRACNSTITLKYTATFTIAPNGPGGTIQFSYTTNNGRSEAPASVSVAPGVTSKTFTFTRSGTLYPDHTFPGNALVMVKSPNVIISSGVKPGGECS